MKKPLIGIPCRILKAEKPYPSTGNTIAYLQAVVAAGGVPILIPNVDSKETWGHFYQMADGILLTGGEDVDPLRYGEQPHQSLGTVCSSRDSLEIEITQRALKDEKPILAICRGLQLLNVSSGGTLFQDINAQGASSIQHQTEQWHSLVHTIEIEKSSKLATILETTNIATNSLHHQSIKDLGEGLKIVGRNSDGIIEAVESTGSNFVVAVQWHPEVLWQSIDARWLKLFSALVSAARGYL